MVSGGSPAAAGGGVSAVVGIGLARVGAGYRWPDQPSGLRITRPRTWPARRSSSAWGAASSGRGAPAFAAERYDLAQFVQSADVAAAENGRSLSSGGLAQVYGFTDLDGSRPDAWRYVPEVQDAGKPADATGYR
jgi:hypothetical protein